MPPIAILVALADPTRCRLIDLLRAGPQPVHVLAAAFKISRPAISRHLRVLKQSGLISETKFGRENRYRLHLARLAPVQRWLADLLPAAKPPAKPDVLASAPPPEPVASPAAAATVVPLAPAEPAKLVASKPRQVSAVSQMGFDF